jgi:Xaa-Pro dipeptidase
MTQHGVDAAYVTRPVSIAYLTGVHADPIERLMALVLRPDGATLVVPALERETAERAGTEAALVAWRDGEDPYAAVAKAMSGARRVAVEKAHLTLAAAEAMAERAGVEPTADVGPQLLAMRRLKSSSEIDALAAAGRVTDAVTEAVRSRLRAGQSELEVSLALGAAIAAAGAFLAFPSLVQSGPNSALPHALPSGRRLARGDLVLLDFGAASDGYLADTTRMAVVGEPDPRQKEIHALVLAAHDAAVEAVRPGATTGAVDAAARSVITKGGHGAGFFHRTGHGLGLEAHEAPSLDPGSTTVLEEGMVFTIEPGVYIPGWGGVRIEDDVVVAAGGARLLTAADRSLYVVEP